MDYPSDKRITKTQQFIDKALTTKTDSCIDWPYAKTYGYGKRTVNGKSVIVPREICELTSRAPKPGEQVAHSCGRPSCINPVHLSWKSPKDNNADKYIHGTQLFGEKHYSSKVTEQQAKYIIKNRNIKTQRELAKEFGISHGNISHIQRGLTWKHLQKV